MESRRGETTDVVHYIDGGTTRCVQAAFRMVLLALAGVDPGEGAADRLTGYVEGRGTWQFRMLLALDQYGLCSIDHEDFDVRIFATDPESAIRKQVGDEDAVQGILAETDIEEEQRAVQMCLQSPNIAFIQSVPSLDNLMSEVRSHRLALVNVNRKVLRGEPGREGHILIVKAFERKYVTVHDPGNGGGLDLKVDLDLFESAWTSPSSTMANYISIWNPLHDSGASV